MRKPPEKAKRPSKGKRIYLTLFALFIGCLAFSSMMLKLSGKISWPYLLAGGIDCAFGVLLTVLVDKKIPNSIKAIVPVGLLLSLIGITQITRIDLEYAQNGSATDFGLRQMIWLAVALALSSFFVAFFADYRKLRRLSYAFMAIGLILLALPLVPGIGERVNGAKVWVKFGSFSWQPCEFAKLFLAIFFASYLFTHRDKFQEKSKAGKGKLPRLKDTGPLAAVWILVAVILVAEGDLGICLMFFALFTGMVYVASKKKIWVLCGVVAFIILFFASAGLFPTFSSRIDIWLHPFSKQLYTRSYGSSYQIVQGLFALGAGGLFGTGFGEGYPALTPFANSDFIYSSLTEQMGFVGICLLLLMYLCLITAGFVIAMRTDDGFGKLLASGLVFSLAFQIFTIAGGITLVLPLTGLTMPFLASGGSSLTADWLILMLLLVIDKSPRPTGSENGTGLLDLSALRRSR
ncbi:MAG: FtsW/RodA/SpoVE family cell cycle protein [Bifidobacteriaceae bacterium]|nr:FtsW/RodA/SpoVE family cell cycle protein [Aeriscardovia sp.]MBQ1803862.1 FtsW/RodA/SpoVE family cell cycle protein [Bifidobacteriaceae bacterium]